MADDELLVRVKLCGNCNPFTDAAKILSILRKREGIRVLFSDEKASDVFLSINGCDRACTASSAGSTGLVVSGWYFGGRLYDDETSLANAVVEALLKVKARKASRCAAGSSSLNP